MASNAENTKRIAKNTVVLYLRTIVMMFISLYTSRVILKVLGVEDFGVSNVVGGVVAMFSIISGSLSGSISRFMTFELGTGNISRLRKIFSTSINIQLGLGLLVILFGETVGLWLLMNKLNIPDGRMYAAHWVLQCSILSFAVNLLSTPFNAAIIAHERMGVFAYMTILDAVLKLLFVYLLYISPFDKLISYAVMMLIISVIMRLIYGAYAHRHFEECHYEKVHDKSLLKEMTSFAWWGFFGNTAWIFNTQGVNILINMFFGVVFNAARGVAGQVESAVMSFVNNFTTAINPQITKSYAAGDLTYMHSLVCRGTKFSVYLMYLFFIPLWFETDIVLDIWLAEVPEYASIFLKLSLVGTMLTTMGNPMLTAIMASGRIRNYEIVTTVIGCLVFPLTYIAYKLGAPILYTYYIYIVIYTLLIGIKMYYAKKLIGLPAWKYTTDVLIPLVIVTALALTVPFVIAHFMEDSLWRLLILTPVSILWTVIVIYLAGLSKGERQFVVNKIKNKFKH